MSEFLIERAATKEAFTRSRETIPMIYRDLVDNGAAPEWLELVGALLYAYDNASKAAEAWMGRYYDLLETTRSADWRGGKP